MRPQLKDLKEEEKKLCKIKKEEKKSESICSYFSDKNERILLSD